jgi:hypothetical protein
MKKLIQSQLDSLSTTILLDSARYHEYTDQDMFNATHIFMNIFLAKAYQYNRDRLSQEAVEDLARDAGQGLREYILKYTGKDMHKVTKELLE